MHDLPLTFGVSSYVLPILNEFDIKVKLLKSLQAILISKSLWNINVEKSLKKVNVFGIKKKKILESTKGSE